MRRFFSRFSGRQLAKNASKGLLLVLLCMFCMSLVFGMVCARPRKFADQTAALFVFAFGIVISGPTLMSILAPFAEILEDVTLSGSDMLRATAFQLVALLVGYLIVRLSSRMQGRLEGVRFGISRSYAYGAITAFIFACTWTLVDADRGNIWKSIAEISSAIETADAEEQRALGNLVQNMAGNR